RNRSHWSTSKTPSYTKSVSWQHHLARHAGYSKWHLQRLFLQYKGESLGRYIRERKLLLAARDLRDTDQRVYDICLKYGFDSQQTFTRVFTRTFNQPPGAYRKENHSRAH
ncbi:helix-turn-helix domain-containing protein, partial [Klebsiella pneumoniae]|uniref:helix-turn-helix domain-containing protein n=3 Tax=Klebsiella pneumoniae TaxID=573 RepID=UPI001E3A0AA0